MPNKKQKSIIKLSPHPALIEQLKKQILKNGGMKIVGFGIFKLQRMKSRKGFHPYTKKPQVFPAYTKIVFTPTKSLKLTLQTWK